MELSDKQLFYTKVLLINPLDAHRVISGSLGFLDLSKYVQYLLLFSVNSPRVEKISFLLIFELNIDRLIWKRSKTTGQT